jgi:alpha-beta hydrolase superfamily lysophospholipase
MTQSTDYLAPDWLRTRGTVIVVPGRGETPASYARFGSRLAHDAYRVRVRELPDADPSGGATFLGELDHELSAAVAGPLADRGALARAARTLPAGRLVVVRGAHHDVLNDLQHRSVAAEIVTFPEALRNDLVPAVDVAASAW